MFIITYCTDLLSILELDNLKIVDPTRTKDTYAIHYNPLPFQLLSLTSSG